MIRYLGINCTDLSLILLIYFAWEIGAWNNQDITKRDNPDGIFSPELNNSIYPPPTGLNHLGSDLGGSPAVFLNISMPPIIISIKKDEKNHISGKFK